MLILFIALSIVATLLALRTKYKWIDENLPFILSMVVLIFGYLAFLWPGDYYESPNVEVHNLGTITSADGTYISDYISRDDEGNYYYLKIDENNRWITSKVPDEARIFVVESPEIEKPILKISETGYKSNKWTFSLGYHKFTYRFELPLNRELEEAK